MHAQHQESSLADRGLRRASPLAATRLWDSRFLSHGERDALAEAVSPAKSVPANTDLIREGERSDTLFFVLEGWAARYTTTRDGARLFPALSIPGDIANLDALMFDLPDYGVRSLSQVTIVGLPVDRTRALVARYTGIAQALFRLALVENATLGKWAQSLGRRSARERLAHLLCELSVRLQAEEGNESSFQFPITQEQVADALGLTAVHVNRTFHQLKDEGLVQFANRTIIFPDVARLRKVGGFEPSYLHGQSAQTPGRTCD